MSLLSKLQFKYEVNAAAKVGRIPKDWPVQPLKPGQDAKVRATCGYCDLSWDDGISTSLTPTPSARCPFENFHKYPVEKEKKKKR